MPKSDVQKKADKAAYDKEYKKRNKEKIKATRSAYYQKTRNPEKERELRKANMHKHIEYCRKPEYRAKKHEYDSKRKESEYQEFAEAWRLLLELEKEIRLRATAYERRVANGYYTRNAQKRRRELWKIKKN